MLTSSQIPGYQIPGVYREELFALPPPEFLTGVPVFLGFTTKGDLAQPQKLTLWTQFAEAFGEAHPNSYLASAVYGFFDNGGRICYVLPLDASLALNEALSNALEILGELDSIDLVCVPDLVHPSQKQTLSQVIALQLEILGHCDLMRDRFAILDPYYNATVAQIQQQFQQLSSLNGALYFPWIQTENSVMLNQAKFVPPCGHIAGIYARSDAQIGVHQAPANYIVQGAVDLSLSISNAEQLFLNPESQDAGINCLRSFPGRGIRVWGARTLSQHDRTWRYVNVRRLVLSVGRWVERNLTNLTFEPNDFRLWSRIERDITTYLESLQNQGAFQGRVSKESFYVKCDAETNPPEAQASGTVITEIGLAPAVPNEFIVIRLIHGDTGVTLA